MDPQGTNLAHLTSWAGNEDAPAWSWDHKHLAMVRPRLDATNTPHSEDPDGTHKHWARSAPSSMDIRYPSWSPDGSRLVVTITLQGNPYLATLELATGNLALIAPQGALGVRGYDASYDPTGQKIVYLDGVTETVREFSPGGATRILVSSDRALGSPTYSPDGNKIAFSKYVSATNREIFVVNVADLATKRLTFSGAVDAEPTWSPDGTKIAFASNRSGKWQIWTMNSATGGSLTRITNVLNASSPTWAH